MHRIKITKPNERKVNQRTSEGKELQSWRRNVYEKESDGTNSIHQKRGASKRDNKFKKMERRGYPVSRNKAENAEEYKKILLRIAEKMPFACPVCARRFSDMENLKGHIRDSSLRKRTKTESYRFTCAVCSKGFQKRYNFQRHLATHEKEPRNMFARRHVGAEPKVQDSHSVPALHDGLIGILNKRERTNVFNQKQHPSSNQSVQQAVAHPQKILGHRPVYPGVGYLVPSVPHFGAPPSYYVPIPTPTHYVMPHTPYYGWPGSGHPSAPMLHVEQSADISWPPGARVEFRQ
mmetsp:Transcript_8063/g.11435  ORF Transcript_8063/g.11435 Transcript_8063/m.11435 type:complete len:291 (+) Transcript_8063:85-957(+)